MLQGCQGVCVSFFFCCISYSQTIVINSVVLLFPCLGIHLCNTLCHRVPSAIEVMFWYIFLVVPIKCFHIANISHFIWLHLSPPTREFALRCTSTMQQRSARRRSTPFFLSLFYFFCITFFHFICSHYSTLCWQGSLAQAALAPKPMARLGSNFATAVVICGQF